MSERKVLNKYYPPDFDPSKIPRMKCSKNRQFTVRLMAPFNMRCKTCGEYIYKGKKFNARKEDVEGEDYLGIRIFRFYIKCTRCLQEISFKTDPRNTDYEIEAGATRNFMALKLAEEQAEREEEERKEEEASNPMKLLENRTQQSKQELELLESLEELRDLNKRQQSVDFDQMLTQFSTKEAAERIAKMQEEEDERFIRSVFKTGKRVIQEEIIEVRGKSKKKSKNIAEAAQEGSSTSEEKTVPTEAAPIVDKKPESSSDKKPESWSKSVGSLRHKGLSNLVKVKKLNGPSEESTKTVGLELDKEAVPTKEKTQPSALALLGSYSGSEGSDSS